MVISQSLGRGGPGPTISERVAKREIRKINDANPVIRATIDTLVANSDEPTLAKKREKAILGVYLNNRIYKDSVDSKLQSL